MNYHNNNAPFPPYETEYVKELKEVIRNMEESRIDYDELPVAACLYCDDLHVLVDDLDNDICMRCGSVNQISIYKDIHEFNKYLTDKNKVEDESD
jgi:hypothetical protein